VPPTDSGELKHYYRPRTRLALTSAFCFGCAAEMPKKD
jgi:hypothetical protein